MRLPKYSSGFTIIELLISMSIIAILAGGIVPSFSKYINDQNLKQAQEQLKSDLRTVQNRALTGALSDRVINDVRVSHWGVLFTSGSGTSLQYFVSTLDSSCPPSAGTFENQGIFTLSNDVKYYNSFVGQGCMFFNIKNGDISGNYISPMSLRYKEDGQGKNIYFNSTGLIWTESD